MAIAHIDSWRAELIAAGRLPQDGDSKEIWDNATIQIGRYLDLLEMARGVYEQRVFQALLDSMQVEEDNEVYETTIGLLMSFPPEQFGQYFAQAFATFLERDATRAGDLLSLLINNAKEGDSRLMEFKGALRRLTAFDKERIADFVRSQERDGWLTDKRGWYDDALLA